MIGLGESRGDASSNSLQFCPLCGKPFTLVSSFNRHLSYCRRAQIRPRNRRKSCRACGVAKAKCSFHSRCSRCTAKGFDCIYDHPAVTKSEKSNFDNVIPPTLSAVPLSQEELSLPGLFDLGDNSVLDLANLPQLDQHPYGGFGNSGDEIAPNELAGQFPLLEDVDLPPESHELSIGSLVTSNFEPANNTGLLTRLRTSEPLARQCTNLVMEALCAIPEQMLRKVTLPPFIHPHWDRPAMPEPLAICMRIAQMFSSRTPDIKSFIWRTILAEQKRIVKLLPNLSKQDLLAAIQAQMVYFMMRIVDGATQLIEWDQEMAMFSNILCERFLDICGGQFCQDEQSHPSTTWEDWIFAESRRRTSCVWFLFTRTIMVKTKAGCPTNEHPEVLPLPSPKTQWEARDRATWMQELEAGSPALCTFGSLIDSKQQCNEISHAQRLDSWNARTDNLGSLLNIAVALV